MRLDAVWASKRLNNQFQNIPSVKPTPNSIEAIEACAQVIASSCWQPPKTVHNEDGPALDVESVLKSMTWGDPDKRETSSYSVTVRTAAPSKLFWKARETAKEELKQAGLHVAKAGKDWVVEWIIETPPKSVVVPEIHMDQSGGQRADPVEKLPPGQAVQNLAGASTEEQWEDLVSTNIHRVSVDKLGENPLNQTLYDRVVNPAILESVEQNGVLVPVRATRNGKLIDGWQRVEAAKSAGYKMVPVIYVEIEHAKELEVILTYNVQRIKNTVERLREYRAYLEIETAKARDRSGLRTDVGRKLPEGHKEWGKSRDLAAKKVGLSGSSAERGLQVLEEIEKRSGTDPAEVAIRKLLNDGINAGWKYAHSLGWIEAAVKPRPIQSKGLQKEKVVSDVRQLSVEETDEFPAGRPLREPDYLTMKDGWLAEEIIAEVVAVVNTTNVAFDLWGLLMSIRPQLYLVAGTDIGEARSEKLKLLAKALSILAQKCADESPEI